MWPRWWSRVARFLAWSVATMARWHIFQIVCHSPQVCHGLGFRKRKISLLLIMVSSICMVSFQSCVHAVSHQYSTSNRLICWNFLGFAFQSFIGSMKLLKNCCMLAELSPKFDSKVLLNFSKLLAKNVNCCHAFGIYLVTRVVCKIAAKFFRLVHWASFCQP